MAGRGGRGRPDSGRMEVEALASTCSFRVEFSSHEVTDLRAHLRPRTRRRVHRHCPAQCRLLRYPSISPDGKTIVFTYKGDLYRVAAAGGTAIR